MAALIVGVFVVFPTPTDATNLQLDELAPSFRIHLTPNDPRFGDQYGHANIALPTAWDSTQGSTTVRVGVVDTGINALHEDLIGQVGAGYNFITETAIGAGTDSDDNGHGTLIAGVIGAVGNNGKGIAGLNWSVELVPLKVADATGSATASDVAEALRYAADNGIRILNISLGSPADFSSVRDAVDYAAARGVVMVGSSGNNGSVVVDPTTDCPTVCYPAAYPSVIAVGSVGSTDIRSSFSNYGPELDLVAPGELILSASDSSPTSYSYASGTSLSAPYVTGTAALVRARFDTIPSRTVLQTLMQNEADEPAGMGGQNFTNEYGYGRINAARAVRIHAAWVSQNAYPTVTAGESYQFEVMIRNTGSSTWQKGEVNLGTDRDRDRIPVFTRGAGWVSNNRVELVEATVAPTNLGTFRFTYTVPVGLAPGVYREYFRPVADGIGWLEDNGIYWDVTVLGYRATWVSQNAYPTLAPGQSYPFEVIFKNTGDITWQPSTVRLGTDRDRDRIPIFTRADVPGGNPTGWLSNNRIQLVETSIAPQANGTFRFYYTVPSDLAPGVYREYFRPVADGIAWLDDWGVYWDVTVLSLAEAYRANWVSQNAYPTLAVGDSYQFEVLIRNTGSGTWQKGVVNLGTDRDRDRIPAFTRGAGWVSNNRVELVETTVAPTSLGTFRFTYTVPVGLAPGVYREYFRPVADGIAWLDDWGVYWDITVN